MRTYINFEKNGEYPATHDNHFETESEAVVYAAKYLELDDYAGTGIVEDEKLVGVMDLTDRIAAEIEAAEQERSDNEKYGSYAQQRDEQYSAGRL